MIHPAISLIEKRVSADRFDASYAFTDDDIRELVRLATLAPTAYNLQNWRFIAVRGRRAKERLCTLAFGQRKVSDAAATFIICGSMPDHTVLADRLRPFVQAGHMPADMAWAWQNGARKKYAQARDARDEAVRSATIGAATLIHAAEAMGFVCGPMSGFDAEGVADGFGLGADEIPVMLVATGRAAPGNWPQKPRRPVSEVLQII